MLNIAAVILAGGKSRRFGRPKALVEIKGKTVVEMVTAEIRKCGISEIVISSNNPEWFDASDMHVCEDQFDDCGPLGGIHSALKNIDTDALLIMACDIPGIKAEQMGMLIDELNEKPDIDIVYAVSPSGEHPLCAVVRKSVLDVIENALTENRLRVIDIYLERPCSMVIFTDEVPFANLNSPEDLVRWNSNGI